MHRQESTKDLHARTTAVPAKALIHLTYSVIKSLIKPPKTGAKSYQNQLP